MAESIRWLHDYTAGLFDGGLPWCDGAQELLKALAAEGTPMALVTNTQRALTDRALNSIGHEYFQRQCAATRCRRANPHPTLICGRPRCWVCSRNSAWPLRTR